MTLPAWSVSGGLRSAAKPLAARHVRGNAAPSLPSPLHAPKEHAEGVPRARGLHSALRGTPPPLLSVAAHRCAPGPEPNGGWVPAPPRRPNGCKCNTRAHWAQVHERQRTEDGLDVNFATNTLGCFVLTLLLEGLLAKAAPAKVVFVSSGGMLTRECRAGSRVPHGEGRGRRAGTPAA